MLCTARGVAARIAALRGSPARRCSSGSYRAAWAQTLLLAGLGTNSKHGDPCAGAQAGDVVRRRRVHAAVLDERRHGADLNAAPNGELQAEQATRGAASGAAEPCCGRRWLAWGATALLHGGYGGLGVSLRRRPCSRAKATWLEYRRWGAAYHRRPLTPGARSSQLEHCRPCASACSRPRCPYSPSSTVSVSGDHWCVRRSPQILSASVAANQRPRPPRAPSPARSGQLLHRPLQRHTRASPVRRRLSVSTAVRPRLCGSTSVCTASHPNLRPEFGADVHTAPRCVLSGPSDLAPPCSRPTHPALPAQPSPVCFAASRVVLHRPGVSSYPPTSSLDQRRPFATQRLPIPLSLTS